MRSIRQIALEPADDTLTALMARIMRYAIYEHVASIVRAIECSEVER